MSDASELIAQQMAAAGVNPSELTPVGNVTKTYVDAQDAALQAGIQSVAGAAGAAIQTANSAQQTAQTAQQAANVAKSSADQANQEILNFRQGSELDIQNGAIVNRHLRDESVTAEKLAQKSVTLDKTADTVLDADNHKYSGKVSASTVKGAIDKTSDRVEYFIANSGNSVAEIVDARIPEDGEPFSTLRDRLDNADEKIAYSKTRKNVKEFGVVGDGETDDWVAMQALLDAGGYIYIPAGKYFFSRGLKISKFVDILGDRIFSNPDQSVITGAILEFNIPIEDVSAISLNENARCSKLENIFLGNISGSKNIHGLSTITSGPNQYMARFTFSEVYTSRFNYGFYLPNCFLGKIENCYASYNKNGFHFQGFSTSLIVERCYALDNEEFNYYVNRVTYSTFSACASDGAKYGYWLRSNSGIVFNACGAENIKVSVMFIDQGNKNIVINALTGYETSKDPAPSSNYASMIHVVGADIADIIINGVFEQTKNNIGTRATSIAIGGTIRSVLNGHSVGGTVSVGHTCLHNGRYQSNAMPTTGYHEAGEMVYNSNSSGGILGWHCFLTGTPGSYLTVRNYQVSSSISTAPAYVGQLSVVSGVAYMATGTEAPTDWKQISN